MSVAKHFGYIHRCQGSVESEVKFLLASCLRVLQSGKLLGIAKAELNLKPGGVILEDIDISHFKIGAHVNFMGTGFIESYHDLYITPHGCGIGLDSKGPSFVGFNLFTLGRIQVLEIDPVSLDFGTDFLPGWNPFYRVTQRGIVTQPDYDLETHPKSLIDEIPLG